MRNKAVAPARKCLHESRTLGRISENFAQPHYRIVQSMIKINKRIARPEPVPQFLARNHIARLFEENGENLERLLGHLQSQYVLANFAGSQVNFKCVTAHRFRNRRALFHSALAWYDWSIVLSLISVKSKPMII